MTIRPILLTILLCMLSVAVPAVAGEINLSAAASLKDVINELSDSFARQHPGVKVLRNFGASGSLARQVENGAPADIFIAASREWIDYLNNRKLLASAGIDIFAYNTLVFAGTPGKASSMEDLPKLEKIAIGTPRTVPAGEYAMAALRKAGLDGKLSRKLVMARDVRECLMYAERREVDGAFVYRSDALQARQARILFAVPRELYPRVTYPMALTVAGTHNRDATAFFAFLRSRNALPVLARYGFAPP